jgi:hypothetical protein
MMHQWHRAIATDCAENTRVIVAYCGARRAAAQWFVADELGTCVQIKVSTTLE